MSVPDNFTFSLQDVINEIGCAENMQSCVSNANPSGYDPNYSSEPGLRKFRNYTHAIDSISLDYSWLDFYDSGSAKTTSVVTVTSSGGWTAEIDYDYDGMISSFTSAGGNQDYCALSLNINYGYYSKGAAIRFICGTAQTTLYLCQDGYAEQC